MSSILKALQRVEREENRHEGSGPPIDPGFVAQPGEPLRRRAPRWVIPAAAVCLGVGLIALLARWMMPAAEPGEVLVAPGSGPVASAPVVPGPAPVASAPVAPGSGPLARAPIVPGPDAAPAAAPRDELPVAKAPLHLPPGVPRTLPADPDAPFELSPITLPRKLPARTEPEALVARRPAAAPEAPARPPAEPIAAPPVTVKTTPPAAQPDPAPVVAARPSVDPDPVELARPPVQPAPTPEVAAPPKAAVKPKPAPVRRAAASAPSVVVERLVWHPSADRREATVRVEGFPDAIQLREGDAVGVLVVTKIEPSAVVFKHGSRELRRRVGAR